MIAEEQARFAKVLQDPLPPVGLAVDFVLVEEDMQLLALHSFKLVETLFDVLEEFGDAALRIVAPRIENEQVVGHEKESFVPVNLWQQHLPSIAPGIVRSFLCIAPILHMPSGGGLLIQKR